MFTKDANGKFSITKNLGKIATVVTLVGSLIGGVFFAEDRYMNATDHDKDIAAKTEINKMKFVELELNVTRMELEGMMGIPEAKRTPAQVNKIDMLRRKQAYLIKNMSY